MVWSSRLKDSAPLGAAAVASAGALPADGASEVALLLAAAACVSAAAGAWRRQAKRAVADASAAAADARQAIVVSETASALLAGPGTDAVPPQLERTLAEVGARLQLCHAPAPRSGEIALPLRGDRASGWFYVDRDGPLNREEAERIIARIAELMAASSQRSRVHDAAAAAEAERQVELAKTAVMHAISHDLRRPLGAIQTAVDRLGDRELDPDTRADLTRSLDSGASQLERIADDLLDLSRIEAGATNPQPEWCALADVVAAAADRVASTRNDVHVELKVPADLPRVRADRSQLERVFCNLLENAAKFSSGDRAIEVRGIAANGRVTIRVLDHGPGIAPAEQGRVFKAFVRGSDPESGSGLGLAICRGFVEANGGRITLQSGARDGSAFAVSFPVAQQPQFVG
jgi:two-component system sensor histidine kinase KdpD